MLIRIHEIRVPIQTHFLTRINTCYMQLLLLCFQIGAVVYKQLLNRIKIKLTEVCLVKHFF